jgi:hypothetical protein
MRRVRGFADWGFAGVSPGAQEGGGPLAYPPVRPIPLAGQSFGQRTFAHLAGKTTS